MRHQYPSRHRGGRRFSGAPKPRAPRSDFQEVPEAAFFVGRLNKNKNREEVYSALRRLATKHDFYIKRLDMPYRDKLNKIGNHGYCFVHCRSKTEADRMIRQEHVQLMGQRCEIKPYGSRPEDDDQASTAGTDFIRSFGELSVYGDTVSELSCDLTSGYATPVRHGQRGSVSQNRVHDDLRKVLQAKYDKQPRSSTPHWDSAASTSEQSHSYNANSDKNHPAEPRGVTPAPPPPVVKPLNRPINAIQSSQVSNNAKFQSQPASVEQQPLAKSLPPMPSFPTNNASALQQYIGTLFLRAESSGTTDQFINEYMEAYNQAYAKVKAMDGQQLVDCANRYQALASLAMSNLAIG